MNNKASSTKSRRKRAGAGVRIELVAEAAGVSISTVSRTLNFPETVAQETRARVLAAVESTGYVRNRLAGSLASSRAKSVGVIIPHIRSAVFADLVRGIADQLAEADYELLLGLSGYDAKLELALVTDFLGQRVSGMMMLGFSRLPETRELLSQAGIPVVETSNLGREAIDMVVGFSNRAAAHDVTMHLHACGYRRIALITLPVKDNDRELSRREGYQEAMTAVGGEVLMVESGNSLKGGALSFARVKAEYPEVDAVFCTNDVLAAGALLECNRRDIKVPDQIGIAGFGDIELAHEFVPALTTIRGPRYEAGAKAGEMLLQRIAGEMPQDFIVDLGYELVQRNSTRKVKP